MSGLKCGNSQYFFNTSIHVAMARVMGHCPANPLLLKDVPIFLSVSSIAVTSLGCRAVRDARRV